MSGGQITSLADVRRFLTGGHARFTLVSKKTGQRKTFQVRREPRTTSPWFVDLLVGPENTSDYKYLAFLWDRDGKGYLGVKPAKDRWGEDAYRVFEWLVHRLNVTRNVDDPVTAAREDELFNAQAEFWHSGSCARCGRELTDPDSIRTGLGPVCAEAR